MSETAAAQLRRILHLIPRLSDGEVHTLEDVARSAGSDVVTVRRDLWSLVTRFHEPAGFVEGVQLFLEADSVELISNHFRRPMRLTTSQLCALELGLAMLRLERPPDEQRAIDGARSRLRATITRLPREAMPTEAHLAAIGADVDPAHLAAARAALRSRRKMQIAYQRGDAERPDDRTISPYALVAASGMFYIVAFCHRSEGLRIFRLDRVHEAAVTADRFDLPDEFSIDRVLREGRVLSGEAADTMRVRYSPSIARWIAEREGAAIDPDGSLTLTHAVADVPWAIRHVLQYGPDAEVLSPAHVRDAVRDRLSSMAHAAGG
jgi:proteasome accessory factor C